MPLKACLMSMAAAAQLDQDPILAGQRRSGRPLGEAGFGVIRMEAVDFEFHLAAGRAASEAAVAATLEIGATS